MFTTSAIDKQDIPPVTPYISMCIPINLGQMK